MSEESRIQSEGAHVTGSVTTHRDFVGRDKVIHNIIVVGQVLDLVRVEGLIPELSDLPDFQNISEAFEATFRDRLGTDLAEATAAVGEILGEALVNWMPSKPSAALPYKRILRDLPPMLIRNLKELGYWDVFCEPVPGKWSIRLAQKLSSPRQIPATAKAIWLSSLQALWKKHRKEDKLYGIAEKTVPGPLATAHLRLIPNSRIETNAYGQVYEQTFIIRQDKKTTEAQNDLANIGHEDFRLFMLGLVIDLIRLASAASSNMKFWEGLIDLLTPDGG